MKAIKGTNKNEKLGQLAFRYLKFVENGLMRNDVENICNVY
jgi:hypothetical protein